MNAADILTAVRADGFELMAEGDRIRIEPGDRLTDEALSLIRAHKAELLRLLAANEPTPAGPNFEGPDPERGPASERVAAVVSMLEADPALNYAVTTHAHIDPEDVILSLAIRGKGACELRVPRSRYDALALLELIEKHTRRETFNSAGPHGLDESLPTDAKAAELRRLVRQCGELYNFSEDEHREALEIALADPENALVCFRTIARERELCGTKGAGA